MKTVRIISGILLSLMLLFSETVGQIVNVLDEGIRIKNVNELFNDFSFEELVNFSNKQDTQAYDSLIQTLTSIEGVEESTAEEIINGEAFTNIYKDVTIQLIKYLRKDSDNKQTQDEVRALVSNAVSNIQIENVELSDEKKAEISDSIMNGLWSFIDSLYVKGDKVRAFHVFNFDNHNVFFNVRIVSVIACVVIIILLCIVLWSIGKSFLITGLISVVVSVPFVLIGIGKEAMIPIKGNAMFEVVRGFFKGFSLPILLYSIIGVILGIIAIIVGISAWLGEKERKDMKESKQIE